MFRNIETVKRIKSPKLLGRWLLSGENKALFSPEAFMDIQNISIHDIYKPTQGHHKNWKSMLNQTSKSLCYRKHKLNIKLEPYLLQVRNKKHRRMLAKLRLSDHKLEIETGRHQRPKVDQDKRICRLCNTSEVENEIHFLMQFTRLRKDFHSSINFIDKQSAEQSYINLMSMKNQDDNIKLADFVSKMFLKRENIFNKLEKINGQMLNVT